MNELSAERVRDLTPQLDVAFESLSRSAIDGNEQAQREMIATCRDYLLYIANQELAEEVRPKCAPSDVVQVAMTLAVERYADFRGDDKRTLLVWLRRILLNQIETAKRKYVLAEKRTIFRESSVENDSNSNVMRPVLLADDLTPSSDAAAREEAALLRSALTQLSDDYQEVLRLRNWERLSFSEIGQQLGRSEAAARKLWGRAVDALKRALE